MISACTWQKKLWFKWQTKTAHFDRNPFQYRSLTQAMNMHNNCRENLPFGDRVELLNSDSYNFLSKLFFLKSFRHDLGLQYTALSSYLYMIWCLHRCWPQPKWTTLLNVGFAWTKFDIDKCTFMKGVKSSCL